MATKAEVLQVIEEEKQQVAGVVTRLEELEEQVNNGGLVTAADLAEIRDKIRGIYEPKSEAPTEPAPEPGEPSEPEQPAE